MVDTFQNLRVTLVVTSHPTDHQCFFKLILLACWVSPFSLAVLYLSFPKQSARSKRTLIFFFFKVKELSTLISIQVHTKFLVYLNILELKSDTGKVIKGIRNPLFQRSYFEKQSSLNQPPKSVPNRLPEGGHAPFFSDGKITTCLTLQSTSQRVVGA